MDVEKLETEAVSIVWVGNFWLGRRGTCQGTALTGLVPILQPVLVVQSGRAYFDGPGLMLKSWQPRRRMTGHVSGCFVAK